MLIFLTVPENAFAASSTVDDALIGRIAAGNMDAFRQLYDVTSNSVYGFALSITKSPYDAEDVLQDSFLTIHKAAASYKPLGKPMAWIFTIVRNCALMKLRDIGKTGELDFQRTESSEAYDRISALEDRMLIKSLLTFLNSEERQIVMLHAVSGLKNREIAALLKLPLNTVLSKYHRAIKKLRIAGEKEEFSE